MAMNCETFKQNIDALLDGELAPDMRAEMERHAEECEACARFMEQAVSLSLMCMELDEGLTVPLPAQAAWRQAVRAEARAKKRPAGGWMRAAAGAAAALVVLVGGTFGVRMGEETLTSAPAIIMAADELTEEREMPFDGMRGGEMARGSVSGMSGMMLQADGSAKSRSQTEEDSAQAAAETVVLKSAARSIRSQSYDSDIQWLNDLVTEYGAYFEERSETAASDDGLTGRVSSMVIRTPSDRLDDFLTELDQLGETLVRREFAEDVTGRYLDTQSRLNTLRLQKQKLEEMLAESKTVGELIAIDDKLTEVIGSIESLEGDMRRWESQKNYSRVTLTLTEAVREAAAPETSLGVRMKSGFDGSVEWLKEFGQDALVTLAAAAPRLVVWLPVLALIVIAVCALRPAKRRK